jgi:hypothetical protein
VVVGVDSQTVGAVAFTSTGDPALPRADHGISDWVGGTDRGAGEIV